MKNFLTPALCLGALVALVATVPAFAEKPVADEPVQPEILEESTASEVAAEETSADASVEAPIVHGMRVFRDPETGELRRPTAAESRAPGLKLSSEMQNALSRSAEGLRAERRADGTVVLDLQGRFRTMSVARRADDGAILKDCAVSPERAAEILAEEAPASPAEREEY